MCGILGIASVQGRDVDLDERQIVRMRDELAHRGPDSAGLWRDKNVALAHRRLAVIDRSALGAQPMLGEFDPVVEGPRFALVYNGELYNDAQLRRELEARGVRFKSACDTETVLHAWATWGTEALHRLRGMFAFGIYDARLQILTLARDPMGIKPLYWWSDGPRLIFASEPRAILAHPDVSAAPNLRMVSAYLTTIRTVLGEHTLFEKINAVPPGCMLRCSLGPSDSGRIVCQLTPWRRPSREATLDMEMDEAGEMLRTALDDSVRAHLRSDVPVCTLLSGGIDSTAVAHFARMAKPDIRSFCAGAEVEGDLTNDRAMARLAATDLGLDHHEAPVTREMFGERWAWMIEQMGVPLSTPNEVAIHEVARTLRENGCVVTLSGEGADELLAGYEGPMDASARFVASGGAGDEAGLFELNASAWAPLDFKSGLLTDDAWREADEDRWLMSWYQKEFDCAEVDAGEQGLAAHLQFHRRVNLTGLLGRLDTATMLAGVEGRTPFADRVVSEVCDLLPMVLKYAPRPREGRHDDESAVTTAQAARTKLVLRRAMAGLIPEAIVERPKASFPLPFEGWIIDLVPALQESSFVRHVMRKEAIDAVSRSPEKLWNLAWPMINLALWGKRWGW